MSGVEIVRRIRQRDDGHKYYLIIQTSLGNPEDVVFALNEGADEYISKPYNPDILRARVNVGCRVVTLHEALADKIRLLGEANQRISQLASTDELTQLYNRRFFNKGLAEAISAAQRHQFPLTLVLLDIDKFKMVNDNFGHDIGDEVLKLVAQTLKSVTRTEDIPARWGGEEFTLVLGHTPLTGAQLLADRLRVRFTELCKEKVNLSVTASFGVVQLKPEESAEDLIKRADKALYRAKKEGRDRVISDPS